MPLIVTWRMDESVAVMDLSGTLTLGPSLGTLRETVRLIIKDNHLSGLVIRVADVTSTDSSGLGELTVVFTLTTNHGRGVRLLNVTPSLRKMLRITCIDRLLPESESLASAKAELLGRAPALKDHKGRPDCRLQ